MVVVLDARRQDVALPRDGWTGKSVELIQNFLKRFGAFFSGALGEAVPTEQKPHVVRGGNGFDCPAQLFEGIPVDARQQASLAPFRFGVGRQVRGEVASDREALRFQCVKRLVDPWPGKAHIPCDSGRGCRPQQFYPSPDHVREYLSRVFR